MSAGSAHINTPSQTEPFNVAREIPVVVPDVSTLIDDDLVTFQARDINSASGGFNISPMELLVDLPVQVGCFRIRQPGSLVPDSSGGSQMPAECLTFCLEHNKGRYGATTSFGDCFCHEEIPFEDLQALPMDQCQSGCNGHQDNQFCGGATAEILMFHVATCPDGQTRFGDHCYIEAGRPLGYNQVLDFCRDQVIIKI